MKNKHFTKGVVALGLSTLCIGNSLSDLFKARAVLTREALLSAYEEIKKYQVEIDPKSSSQDKSLQTEVDKNKDKVKTASSEIQHINGSNIDWGYLRHLDLAIGAVLERTGVLNDIRFFNGFIKEITVNDNNMRQFKNDSGIGLANVMTALFPSPTGELAVGNNIDMSPELIAKIFGFLHMLRERYTCLPPDINAKINSFMNLAKKHNRTKENVLLQVKNLSDAKDVLEKKLAELKDLEKEISVEPTEDTEQKSEKELKKIQRAKEKAKQKKESRLANIPEIQTALSDIDAYIKIEDLLNTKAGAKNVVRPEKRNTFLKLLYDLSVTINDQEGTEATASNDRPLKQYTAESILLGYFVKKFDTKEEVSEFYRALPEQIKLSGNRTSEVTKEDALSEVKKLHDMLEKAMPKNNIPYYSKPLSNGIALQTTVEGDTCYFDKAKRFADCVDTSVRHLVNLMTYNANDEKFHIPGSTCNITNQDLDELKDAYNQRNKIKHKSVKERLHMYYLYQNQQFANNGDELTRSLWNHVISNISSKNEGMYDVVYMKEKNELSSGLVNVLKMYYNLVYSLRDGQDCEEAKNAIDKVITLINSATDDTSKINQEELKNILSNAFKETLKLFNDKYDLNIDVKGAQIQKKSNFRNPAKNSWMDVFGTVCVTVHENNNDLFNFEIEQQIGHGAILCNIQDEITLNEEEKHLLENEYAALLYDYSNQPTYLKTTPHAMYHKSATGFISRIDALNQYYEKIGRWIAENNIIMLSEDIVNISYNDIDNTNLLVNYMNKKIPLVEWTINSAFSTIDYWVPQKIVLWYVLNVLSNTNMKCENFEKIQNKTIEKYKIFLEILKKKELSVSDIDTLKSFNYSEFQVNSPYGCMIDRMVTSSNEVVEKCIENLDIFPDSFGEKLAQTNRWDMVEKLLEKHDLFNKMAIILAQHEQFDLLLKFKEHLNFNAPVSISNNYMSTYNYLESLIKDPELKKKLFPNLNELILKEGKLTLDDMSAITKNEFNNNKDLIKRCAKDLSDEDFATLINRYRLSDSSIDYVLTVTLKLQQLGKTQLLLDNTSNTNGTIFKNIINSGDKNVIKTYIEKLDTHYCRISFESIDALFKLGDKELIQFWAKKIQNSYTDIYENQTLISTYIRNVMHDEKIADLINPMGKVFQKIMDEKKLDSIPVYDDVNKYFEIHEGISIAMNAIKYLSDEDFKLFLEERLPLEKVRGKNLFNQPIEPSGGNFVMWTLLSSTQKGLTILDYIPKGEIDRNSFTWMNGNILDNFDSLYFESHAEYDSEEINAIKKKLYEMGLSD